MNVLKKSLKLKQTILALALFSFASTHSVMAMQVLSDNELQQAEGQALLNLSYLAPTDASSNANINGNVGFYRLGMEAEVELNANIRSLQLGCGGINGAGGCDIDIDYLSLSGLGDTNEQRAASSAVLNNPFIEFAIKNPDNPALREVTGFRLSAEAIRGLLTFGLENSDTPSGINSLSGYMITEAATGTVTTNPVTGITQANTGTAVTGKATILGEGWTTNFTTTDYNMTLSSAQGNLIMDRQVITGKRMTTANLTATARMNGIQLGGTLKADTTFLGIKVSTDNLQGTVNNLAVDLDISQGLGFFHKINLNGTAASLSLQAQNIKWPGAESLAQTGWWMELSNPIEIGDITPQGNIDISLSTIVETLGLVSDYLTNTRPVNCGVLATSCLLLRNIDTGTVTLGNNVTPATMKLADVVLQKQNFAPNCWGNVKFC